LRIAALGALTSVGLVACGSPEVATSTDSLGAPLVAGVAGSTGTWVSLPAGQLGSPATTFWQLVHGAGSSWRLETPPGVATNGGLVTSLGPKGQLVVGFEPSQLLRFSPLVSRATPAGPWGTGALPGGLVAVPDALATSSRGRILAIVATNGGEVLSSSRGLSDWSGVGSLASINSQSAPGGCKLRALSAVAFQGVTPIVGGSCTSPSPTAPIDALINGRWRNIGPRGDWGTKGVNVLRLTATRDGVAALIEWRGIAKHVWLVSAHESRGSSTWRPGFAVDVYTIVFTLSAADGSSVIVSRDLQGVCRIMTFDQHGVPGTYTSTPPGACVVSGSPSAGFEALGMHGSTLDVYAETRAPVTWRLVQRLTVPITLGSSR
jgi:hypothetical protein